MTTRFLLVRHGETASSRERRFAGSTDVDLTEHGLEQAAALARRLRQIRVDVMYSSPLRRCLQTSQAITDVLGCTSTVVEGIRECHFGEWENLTLSEVVKGWPEDFQRWVSDEAEPPPAGECWREVGERVLAWFEEAGRAYEGQTVLAVMHGGPIMQLARHLLQLPRETVGHLMIEPGSVSVVHLEQGRVRVRAWNDTTHYGDPLLDGHRPATAAPQRS